MFCDGPPFVNASNLHLGHQMIGVLKDSVLRFHRMHNKKIHNKIGFDTHGLPIEGAIMKELGLNSANEIIEYGIPKFNKYCKDAINKFSKSWEPLYEKMGRWVNFDNTYKTMDTNFMESCWWIFNELNKKELIYKGYKVMPYSYGCETPLSNFEAGLNYKEIETKSIYVGFKLVSNPMIQLVAWTTTPWTLFSNIALCVNANAKYMIGENNLGHQFIISEKSIKHVDLDVTTYTFYCLGKDLVGLEYVPLYTNIDHIYHKVIADDYVKESEIGTGIVHIAPCYGEDDHRVSILNNAINAKDVAKTITINSKGEYLPIITEYAGKLIFDCNKDIIIDLKKRGITVKTQVYSHQYPFCYRTDTPLIYMIVPSFFVEVTKIKDRMIELNDTINWSNKDIGEGRFKNWLENARDWSISRNRFFGTPIPIWQSEDGTEIISIGSIDQLVKLAKLKERPTDLHLESISHIKIISEKTGNILTLSGDVFDCWYESGCVPYGQIHYPFENRNYFDGRDYLSDFVAEGLDQTRGWFYTLLVLSTAIMDKAPFKNVICTGLILDKDGKKISKKYGNYVDINLLISRYGSDIMRLYLLKSPLINGEPLLFNESHIGEVTNKYIQLVNSVKFFIEHYTNMKDKHIDLNINYIVKYEYESTNLMDMWILERICNLRITIEKLMEDYKIDIVIKELIGFIEDITNWYIKFNRDRLKGLDGLAECEISLSVLYTILYEYIIIIAPFMPFLSEHLFKYMPNKSIISSCHINTVHSINYPNTIHNYNTLKSFDRLYNLTRIIRGLRSSSTKHVSAKVPIKNCKIYHYDETYLNDIKKLIDLLQDEVNCLNFEYILLDDDSDVMTYIIKPNDRIIGKKYRKDAQLIKNELIQLDKTTLKQLYDKSIKSIDIAINSGEKIFNITLDEFEINIIMKVDVLENEMVTYADNMIVLIDFTYDDELHDKFEIHKFVSKIQNTRKQIGLKPWNKIELLILPLHDYNKEIIIKHIDYINFKLTGNIIKIVEMDDLLFTKYENQFDVKYMFHDISDIEVPCIFRIIY